MNAEVEAVMAKYAMSGIGHKAKSMDAGADSFAAAVYYLRMPQYFFHIQQDGHSSDYSEGLEFPDNEAARKEAAAICADMMRGIVGESTGQPEWRLDVTDAAGKLLFRFRFVAETFE
jgi:hypothetical protein